jgi:DNA invertase Pin-like site-specific DNA recombinase
MSKSYNSSLRLLNVCRVSSKEQNEGYSLDVQNQTNTEWTNRKGYTIVDNIQYIETTSKQKERKRFKEIIDRICKYPLIDGAVFHKVDRACRNMTDLVMLEKIETEKTKKCFSQPRSFRRMPRVVSVLV